MEAIKLCRLDTPIIFIEARINLSRFVVTGCAAKTSTDRKSGSAGMPRPISYAVFCLKKKTSRNAYGAVVATVDYARRRMRARFGYYGFVSDGFFGLCGAHQDLHSFPTRRSSDLDKTLQVGYANHFYRSAHKFEQICRHRLRRQNVDYSNFSQPQSHLSFCVLLQYLVERRRVVTQLGKLD